MERVELPERGVLGIRAPNPGPFTLSGTNSWIVGQDPAWLIDPGPRISEHLETLTREVGARGGCGGIALTHDHPDHAEAVDSLRQRLGAPVAAARGAVDEILRDGDRVGPLTAICTPGHAPDHLAFVFGEVGFSGDAVLGEGSVFVAPYPGALSAYLEGLRRLAALGLQVLCPGHGPVVREVGPWIEGYIAHRTEREQRLVAALADGLRSDQGLLDTVWSDAPAPLRPAAAVTLTAHLDKLAQEGRLPEGVQWPALPPQLRGE